MRVSRSREPEMSKSVKVEDESRRGRRGREKSEEEDTWEGGPWPAFAPAFRRPKIER